MKRELALQQLWLQKGVALTNLRDSEGGRVDVIETGLWNRGDGPDFLDASVCVGGVVCRGDVEIHLRSADWYAHGHHRDPAYNRVVLHVGLDVPARPLLRLDGTPIPCTDLSTALPAWLGASLRHADDGLPCAAELPRHGAALREQLTESSELYFEELAHSVLGFHTPGRPLETAWKRALFLRCCSVLGIPDNRTQMVSAGEKLWLSRTKPPAGDLFAWCATDSAGTPIDWRRSGSRPAGHPRRRVPQAAHLLGAIAATPLAQFQNAPPRPLGASLWGSSPALGAQMRRVLHGTALLPALWVLATLSGRHRRAGEIRRAWLAAPLPPAPQARKAFVQAGITLGPAGGKGATHLWRTLCSHRLCARCRVGNACGVPPRS